MRNSTKSTNRELAASKLAELKENARGILAESRRALLNFHPFVGGIAMNLNLVPVRDKRLPTAATDGQNIFFDIAFLARLTPEERQFVIAHEIWHNVMMHFLRCEGRNRELFNIATDMEINQILKNDGLVPPKDVIFPHMYGLCEGQSAEEYYEQLVKNKRAGGSNGKGNSNGELKGQFDRHIYSDEQLEDPTEATGSTGSEGSGNSDKYGVRGTDDEFNPNVKESAIEEIREAAITAAQQIERTRGELPAHLKNLINKLLEPEIHWEEVLQQFVTRCLGDKRQWNPPNRRHIWHDAYFQSRRGEKLKIAVGIDTSGSVMNDLPKFLGELNGLVSSFGNYEIHLIQCDSNVQNYELYDDANPLDLEREAFEAKGFGGTRLHPIFDYIEENGLEIDACVMFTDGYTEKFPAEDAPIFPVLWMVTKGGKTDEFDFGEVCMFDAA